MIGGFKYRGIDSSTYNLAVKTVNNPLIAEERTTTESVIGRDGAYIFKDGRNEKEITFKCTLIDTTIENRRLLARQIANWLSESGDLIYNFESNIKYEARVSDQVDLEILNSVDEFEITFIVQPIAESVTEYTVSDTATGNKTTSVTNDGTYKALPVIVLSGTATSITITDDNNNSFTYNNLNGTVYIDCKNKLVYSISGTTKINQRSNFSGNYIKLLSGTNSIDISGTITSVDIDFVYRYAYL